MLDRDTWKFINSFAPWLSALGTLLAVVVSLYLAGKSTRAKLKVSVGHRFFLKRGNTGPSPEYIVFRVVNLGNSEVKLTGLGWQIGFFKKVYLYQDIGDSVHSCKMPIMISHGEEATYYIELKDKDKWVKDFVKDYLVPHPTRKLMSLKVYVNTSIGSVIYGKVEDGLKKIFLDESNKLL